MRSKTAHERYIEFSGESSLIVVQEYREKYRAISDLLDGNPQVPALIHHDLARLSTANRKGCSSDFSSEQLLRALIVMYIEHTDYRDTVVRISNSDFLRNFVRLAYGRSVMDYTFLNRAHSAVSESTWTAVNKMLSVYAFSEKKIDGEKCRVDTTAVETNIHYPTDSSLLWDSFRTLIDRVKGENRGHSTFFRGKCFTGLLEACPWKQSSNTRHHGKPKNEHKK